MIEIMRARRSTRKFTDKAVEPSMVRQLEETCLRSPTSKNNRPCEFIFVDDAPTLEFLSDSKPHGAAFLKGAPLALVIAADPEKSDVWVEDASIAAISVQYVAQSLGLGSCWIQIRKRMFDDKTSSEQKVREILGIPENLRVASVVAVGHPVESREPVPFEKLDFSKIRVNDF